MSTGDVRAKRVCVSLQKGIGHWLASRVGNSCALGDDREVWDPCVLAFQGSEMLDYCGVRKDMGQHYLFT